jgi:hypothetical protein
VFDQVVLYMLRVPNLTDSADGATVNNDSSWLHQTASSPPQQQQTQHQQQAGIGQDTPSGSSEGDQTSSESSEEEEEEEEEEGWESGEWSSDPTTAAELSSRATSQ